MHRSHWYHLLTSRAFLFFCLAGLILNAILLVRSDPQPERYNVRWSHPDEAEEQPDEVYAYVKREYRRQKNYTEKMRKICEEADNKLILPFFSKEGSFAAENLKRTKAAYEDKVNSELPHSPGAGVVTAADGLLPGLILLFLILAAAATLFIEDTTAGRRALILTTRHGRGRDYRAKVAVLLELTVLLFFLLWGMRFAYAACVYGLGDMSRPAQSVWTLMLMPDNRTVGEFLIRYWGNELLVLLAASLVIHLLAVAVRERLWLYLAAVLFGGAEFFACQEIPGDSPLSVFRYVNVFSCLQMEDRLGNYKNLNIFGHCVNERTALAFAVGAAALLCLVSGRILYGRKERTAGTRLFSLKIPYVPGCHLSVGRHEWYKSLRMGHLALLLPLFLVSVLLITPAYSDDYADEDSFYYYYYIHRYSGELSPEKNASIRREESNYQKWHSLYASETSEYEREKLAKKLKRETGFRRFLNRRGYAAAHSGAQLIDDRAFCVLSGFDEDDEGSSPLSYRGNKAEALLHWVLGIAALLFCLPGIWTLDSRNRCEGLIRATRFGRKKLHRLRARHSLLLVTAVYLIVYAPQFFRVRAGFAYQPWSAPANSLTQAEWLGAQVPVWGYFMILYFMRYAGFIIFAALWQVISCRIRKGED